ncbi:MAG: ABC transporter permease [Anaerolineae bacterium]|uniref:ABC transporter permease n=1 Tax=Promineifilum sp. TaxID=2664178 RepID=UPI001D4E158C|nr:ABC transporter permease [Anaerolineales bacterium]MCB8933871.1 ABC transporter permease [Promineifilum sp.]MCO5181376.1 ABC transporter permease [Promineifilum sp.]MCW5846344.1 ABC transporter permease [Anaerolineae bacterium]
MTRRNPFLTWLDDRPTWLTITLSFLLLLGIWHLLVVWGDYPPFILPGPADVGAAFVGLARDGRLLRHTLVTLSEVIPGLALGVLVALPLAYLLTKSPLAERLISPYLIASQAIPIIAIAPLLSIWVQSWYWSRVLVAALVVFFPILVNSIAGFRAVPREFYDLMHSLRATKSQIFRKLELPAALPTVLAGLKVGATLAVIGALVGEFVQPKSQGLGFLLVTARYQFKTDEVFVVLLTLGAMALSLYGLVALAERRLLRWRRFGQGGAAANGSAAVERGAA